MTLTIQANPELHPRHEQASLVLVDDNASILDRVVSMLEKDYQIVGTACDGPTALRTIEVHKPDVVVLDVCLGDTNGIDLARQLRATGYSGSIVFLTVHDDPDFVSAAFSAGGSGYVTKSQMAGDLVTAIQAVLEGRSFVSASNRIQ
jgi:DNA-binding NarL/FixJ family response regulator